MTHIIKYSRSSSNLLPPPTSPVSPLESKTRWYETFQVIWLDPNVQTDIDNQATYNDLQQIFAHIRTFNDCNKCEHWLKNYQSQEKIILIVSGQFGKIIIPRIHDLKSIVSIYIYCMKRVRHEGWAKKYRKVKGIATVTTDLTQQLSSHQKELEIIEDSKAIQIIQYHNRNDDLNSKNVSFICYQLLLDTLISTSYLPVRNTSAQLARILRQYYDDNAYHLASFEEFIKTYQTQQALLWLVRDTPVKRFINKALREQHIHILFLLRSFLKHIHFRLSTRSTDALRAYKLQRLSLDEIEYLKISQDQYLFFPGFLCTSTTKPTLESFKIDSAQYQNVLLEIDAQCLTTKSSFAYINDPKTYDEDVDNRKVLFMCGSIFRIGFLKEVGNYEWILQLKLVDADTICSLTSRKQQLRQNNDLCLIGNLLEKCTQYDQAIKYYECLLRELPADHRLLSSIEENLKRVSRAKSTSLNNSQFVFVDLLHLLSHCASAMFDALQNLTNGIVMVFTNGSYVDFKQFADKTIYLFTSTQWFSSIEHKLDQKSSIFMLESDPNKVDQQQRFATSEDLICQLADEMYRCYKKEAQEHFAEGNLNMAKNKENLADQIHNVLRKTYQKIMTTENEKEVFVCTKVDVVWLKSQMQHNGNIEQLRHDFSDIISSYLVFDNIYDCEQYLSGNGNKNVIVLIIDIHYDESITTHIEHSINVKFIYHHGASASRQKETIENLDDLRYRLAYDLIAHYDNLGTECRNKNDMNNARVAFSKAKKLCDLLAKF